MHDKKSKKKKIQKKDIKTAVARVIKDTVESKFYAYTPVATGTANTTGLKYLLNAMPWSRASVTGGIVDDTGGMRGGGSKQLVGTDYNLESFSFSCQLTPNGANSISGRMIIFRESSPEGVTFTTGPESLLESQAAGEGVISPIYKTNLIGKDGMGRFKIYYDKNFVVSNNISANNVKKLLTFKKTFKNPLRVQTYPTITAQTQGSAAVCGNIIKNSIWCILLFDSTTVTIEQVKASIMFKDA